MSKIRFTAIHSSLRFMRDYAYINPLIRVDKKPTFINSIRLFPPSTPCVDVRTSNNTHSPIKRTSPWGCQSLYSSNTAMLYIIFEIKRRSWSCWPQKIQPMVTYRGPSSLRKICVSSWISRNQQAQLLFFFTNQNTEVCTERTKIYKEN